MNTKKNNKMKVFKNSFGLLFFAMPIHANAQHNGVGGGDLCRQVIENHRDHLSEWIMSGEAKDLNFDIARVKGWTYDCAPPAKNYKHSMLDILTPGVVTITCYTDTQELTKLAEKYDVVAEKIEIGSGCINYEDEFGKSNIGCDSKSILDEDTRHQEHPDTPDENYKLTHHEFASIKKIEARLGAETSDFSISDQLAQFRYNKIISLLGPKHVSINLPSSSSGQKNVAQVQSEIDNCFEQSFIQPFDKVVLSQATKEELKARKNRKKLHSPFFVSNAYADHKNEGDLLILAIAIESREEYETGDAPGGWGEELVGTRYQNGNPVYDVIKTGYSETVKFNPISIPTPKYTAQVIPSVIIGYNANGVPIYSEEQTVAVNRRVENPSTEQNYQPVNASSGEKVTWSLNFLEYTKCLEAI